MVNEAVCSVNPDSHSDDHIPNLDVGVNMPLNPWHALYAMCVWPNMDFYLFMHACLYFTHIFHTYVCIST